MFRIRRVYDDILPVNQRAIREAEGILRSQFELPVTETEQMAARLRDPFRQKFRSILYVADNSRGRVLGFAIVMHDDALKFCFLDYIAAGGGGTGRGIGAALYERVRDEALSLGSIGLFLECVPDEPDLCKDPKILKQNISRLRFYEQYDARPIRNTAYESPFDPNDTDNLPYLVFDGLDQGKPLRAADARKIARAILELNYEDVCPPSYINKVVKSFQDDPVLLRDFHYTKEPQPHPPAAPRLEDLIPVVINDKHDIHHVRERGYVEAPVRISVIQRELEASGLTTIVPARRFPERCITAVHAKDFVNYLQRACANVPDGQSVYPYVFPIRNAARPPRELSVRAGYYCIDTFTPLNKNAYLAARGAVDCALTAADEILKGRRLAYALVRPPGHHAERRSFGGFCYFSNSAIAAQHLSELGKVAILDVDYHHGNGQQDIFYERNDVLTVSIHGDPSFAYPYFTGFADERGSGPGLDFNLNIALPEVQDGAQYRKALTRALKAIVDFKPLFLVVALGLDPAKGDPTGTWMLNAKDFRENGEMIGQLGLPTVVIQEGGYRTRTLGTNACQFFKGLAQKAYQP